MIRKGEWPKAAGCRVKRVKDVDRLSPPDQLSAMWTLPFLSILFFLGGEGMFVDSYKCKALLKDGSLNSKVKR